MAKRALAHIEQIAWIKPIEGADNIELVGVLGWQCIAKKNEFMVGDTCVYIEIDSKVPATEEFEFLKGRNYKIKTIKFSKFKDEYGNPVISQGIALNDKQFDALYNKTKMLHKFRVGDDVTDVLGITYSSPEDIKRKSEPNSDAKYQSMIARRKEVFSKPWVKKMMRHKWFRTIMFAIYGKKKDKPLQFPSWIQKTDEERIENLPQYLTDTKTVWMMTEKIDGTSTTFALERKHFGKFDFIVCSRNVRQREPDQPCWFDENVYWKIAQKYDVENKMHDIMKKIEQRESIKVDKLIMQGETFGAKLHGNQYKMNDIDFRAFNLVVSGRSNSGQYVTIKYITSDMESLIDGTGIKCVPILGTYQFPEGITMAEFKQFADGKSVINEDVMREGIVFRNVEDARQSFKNVSNTYLLKHSS
jgi:hypothetical protein